MRYRQLQVKDLPKVPMWQLEQDSNPRPPGRKASTPPMRHHAPLYLWYCMSMIPAQCSLTGGNCELNFQGLSGTYEITNLMHAVHAYLGNVRRLESLDSSKD